MLLSLWCEASHMQLLFQVPTSIMFTPGTVKGRGKSSFRRWPSARVVAQATLAAATSEPHSPSDLPAVESSALSKRLQPSSRPALDDDQLLSWLFLLLSPHSLWNRSIPSLMDEQNPQTHWISLFQLIRNTALMELHPTQIIAAITRSPFASSVLKTRLDLGNAGRGSEASASGRPARQTVSFAGGGYQVSLMRLPGSSDLHYLASEPVGEDHWHDCTCYMVCKPARQHLFAELFFHRSIFLLSFRTHLPLPSLSHGFYQMGTLSMVQISGLFKLSSFLSSTTIHSVSRIFAS